MSRATDPTDAPVMALPWVYTRNVEAGTYLLGKLSDAGLIATGPMLQHVVDDHGDLVPLGHELTHARWSTWVCSEDFEPAGTAWWEARMAQARADAIREGAARATRNLLRPPPVQVKLVMAPIAYPDSAAAITIGADERLRDAAAHTPSYRIACDHQVLTLTHAQLCALMLAAQQLIASTQRPRGARVQ